VSDASTDVKVANDFRSRLRGLAWCDRSQAPAGLLIPRCSSVHTFGMRFELDVYFLDRAGRVLSVRRRVPPCRFLWAEAPPQFWRFRQERGESLARQGLSHPCFLNEMTSPTSSSAMTTR
jgi:Uncharacterized ACR, COG1430